MGHAKQQIPFGNDRKKSKSNGKSKETAGTAHSEKSAAVAVSDTVMPHTSPSLGPPCKSPPRREGFGYLAGGGVVKISRRAGSGFGFGLGAFFASLRPLSFCPMGDSVPQISG
jgi:hypothetical protein